MTHDGRGILAADESIKTMSSRLEQEGIPLSAAARRDYRELLIIADELSEWVSGVIWCDETFGQELTDGRPFPQAARELGILPGIKVDTGTSFLPGRGGALVTEGLDGLGDRLASSAERGAAFAKWRAVFDVGTITPYTARANGHALARYAALCQEHGIVPIVEPEVLCNGDHDLGASAQASRLALRTVFDELAQADVDLSGIVLKPNFVTPASRLRQRPRAQWPRPPSRCCAMRFLRRWPESPSSREDTLRRTHASSSASCTASATAPGRSPSPSGARW
jgi:fructose-bisphosphate aldolase class I